MSLGARTLRTFAAFALLLPAGVCAAQALPARDSGLGPSRFDIYGGYMYVKQFNSGIGPTKFEDIGAGGLFGASYWFRDHLGVQLEGAYSPEAKDDTHCWITAQAGPIARFQRGRFVPFVHALAGGAQIGGPGFQPCDPIGYGVTGGGGLDYVLPVLHNRIAVRPFQVDFTYSHIPVSPQAADINALRLSTGVNFRFGTRGESNVRQGVTLGCSADPGESFPGTPVTLSATAENLMDGRDLRYLWTTTGGAIRGTEATETIDTRALSPGTYNVSVQMVRGDRQKPIASCMTSFVLSNPVPPTVSCSANQSAINSGVPVTITTVAQSARPLTYSYTATNGQVTGNGATAQLSTIGSTPGTITVTCKATDDKGLSGQATASVVIATPAPVTEAAPTANRLCTLMFTRDRRRPNRVDNEAKGCLDDIAINLNRDPNAKLVMIGSHGAGEANRDAAERVLNASDYLVKEKGIDRARLDLRTNDADAQQVATMLVPAGATIDGMGMSIDASKVKRSGQAYGMAGQRGVRRTVRRKRRTVRAAVPETSGPGTAPTHVIY